mgnify:CR=1 FL=1|tara:strand:+ start:14675 stop:17677 length:3003 start_codon:yes stop_codon:yes gene_type:complete
MKFISSTLFLIFIFSLNGCSKNEDFTSSKVKFNSGWHFLKVENETITDEKFISDNNFDSWEKISLPHTANIEPKIVNNQWQGVSWYKKEFSLPIAAKGKKHFLHFEGAMNIAEVWVNNKKLIKHQGGYLPFVIDFSDVANFDKKNTIAVKLNNKDNPITGPKPLETLDFNTYGGIYRNVWLLTKNQLYITDAILENKTASGGIFVTYPKVSKEKATINIKTHIRNETDKSASFLVRNTLLKNNIEVVSVDTENYDLAINDHQQITSNIQLKDPDLWSPKIPNLYHLKTEIIQNGSVIDAEITRIGIKTMKFVGQDFYLNGEKTFLRGVNRHQEYPFIGYALSDNANYRDAKKIKEAGFDYVRLSHYPQSKAFMNACDELGLVTIDAILGWQYFSEDKKFQKHVFQTAKDLIRRDRNHASVMAWEVSLNESWMPESFIDSLITIAKKEYPGDQNFTAGWQSYGYDMYLQARQHRLQHYDKDLKKPYNVSEYGDWEYYAMNAGLNQDDWSGLLQQERSSRQLRSAGEKALLQQATNIQEAHNDNLNTPAFADGYWVMFDYNRGYADDLEASGIMDIFRLPKPAYYFYQSQRDANDPFGKPMVYIANNWQKDSSLDIRIFSNCDEVELFLNGKSLGKQTPNTDAMSTNLKHPPFTFTIPKFIAGTLEAKAYINKKLVVSDSRKTPLAPKNIKIVIDNEYDNLEKLDSDVFFVHAYITDKNGTVTPNFKGEITFAVDKGNAQIIGESTVSAVAGIASILVKTIANINAIQFSATSKDLKINAKSESQVQNISNRFLNQQDKSNGFCIVKGDSSKEQIALTFDDGPTNISSEIIDLLNKYNAKATFFWQGKNLKGNKQIIEKAKKSGHLIANHSWNHENGNKSTNEDLWKKQVEKTFKELALNGISEANYYRPPYGAITQQQIDFLAEKNIKTVLWSITTKDWDKTQNAEGQMFKKFQKNIHNGAIVLLHDFDFGNPKAKLQDLEQILKYGKSLGFSFVHIDDVI